MHTISCAAVCHTLYIVVGGAYIYRNSIQLYGYMHQIMSVRSKFREKDRRDTKCIIIYTAAAAVLLL